jgi:hypothetical protein
LGAAPHRAALLHLPAAQAGPLRVRACAGPVGTAESRRGRLDRFGGRRRAGRIRVRPASGRVDLPGSVLRRSSSGAGIAWSVRWPKSSECPSDQACVSATRFEGKIMPANPSGPDAAQPGVRCVFNSKEETRNDHDRVAPIHDLMADDGEAPLCQAGLDLLAVPVIKGRQGDSDGKEEGLQDRNAPMDQPATAACGGLTRQHAQAQLVRYGGRTPAVFGASCTRADSAAPPGPEGTSVPKASPLTPPGT